MEPTEEMDQWFWQLSDEARLRWVVLALCGKRDAQREIAYAVSKPWKYIREAYEKAHEEE